MNDRLKSSSSVEFGACCLRVQQQQRHYLSTNSAFIQGQASKLLTLTAQLICTRSVSMPEQGSAGVFVLKTEDDATVGTLLRQTVL